MRWRNVKIMRCNLRHQKETERRKTTHSNKQWRRMAVGSGNVTRTGRRGKERKTNAEKTRRIFGRRSRYRRASRHIYICIAVSICRCGHEKLVHFSSQSWFPVPISRPQKCPCCCCPCCFSTLFHHHPLHLTFLLEARKEVVKIKHGTSTSPQKPSIEWHDYLVPT